MAIRVHLRELELDGHTDRRKTNRQTTVNRRYFGPRVVILILYIYIYISFYKYGKF